MNWTTRRKLVYAFGVFVFLIAFSVYSLRNIIFPAPTCFDTKQNGYESGIDCGGTCSLFCTADVTPLGVEWTRVLSVASSTYDLVAMISNKNIDNAPRSLGYSFVVYNASGIVMATISGTTIAPINGEFPIIKQSVMFPEPPKEIIMQLHDGPHFSVVEKPTSPTVRSVNTHYESGSIPRVYSTVINTKRITLSNLPVRVVLYDASNNAFAVGETVIPFLDKENSKDISFTWDAPLVQIPTTIRTYPIFDPFVSAQ